MKKRKNYCLKGILLMAAFMIWTVLVQTVDVQSIGETRAAVGFATLNSLFHRVTGVHLPIYAVTDWMGLVPVFVCLLFASIGAVQLVKRKSLLKVDRDIVFLGIYYILVILIYLIFEMVPINFRPILIDGRMEASYPSSTTLLVLSVMPTLVFQSDRRVRNGKLKKTIRILASVFSLCMVIGRSVSGVHWVTDIVGAVLLSGGLVCLYKAAVLLGETEEI